MRIWLKKSSWYTVVVLSGLIYLVTGMISAGLRKLHADALLALLFFAAKYVVEFPAIIKQQNETDRAFAERTMAYIPPVFMAFIKLNYRMALNVLKWISRKPAPASSAEGIRFGYLEKGQYQTWIWIILIALFAEAPFSGFMISLIEKNPHTQSVALTLISCLWAYTLFFILGDRYTVIASCHVLTPECLMLSTGDRFSGTVPFTAIQQAVYLRDDKRIWCVQHKVASVDTIKISPADAPNVIIELKHDAHIEIESLKLKRPCPRFLFIYVDEPTYLVSLLTRDCPVAPLAGNSSGA